MIKETKIGDVIIVKQTTWYVYDGDENRNQDKPNLITSDKKIIKDLKKRLKA